jgi:two-component system chemotaxis response regulator CheY
MKILLIEDELISRMALVDALRPLRQLVPVEAESAQQAWQMLSEGCHPALCCCDVRMPGMSGIELLENMRADARLRHVPVLLVSGASDRRTVTDGLQLGMAGFIVKPFRASELRAKVETLLGANLEALFELPATAIARLGIAPARYAAYLDALASQLSDAVDTLRTSALQEQAAHERAVLDSLHAGCVTLGAHYCSRVIDGMRYQPLSIFLRDGLEELERCAVLLGERAVLVRRGW